MMVREDMKAATQGTVFTNLNINKARVDNEKMAILAI
jgi:hypothetical protein